jgi:hypothetical protein
MTGPGRISIEWNVLKREYFLEARHSFKSNWNTSMLYLIDDNKKLVSR